VRFLVSCADSFGLIASIIFYSMLSAVTLYALAYLVKVC
jgi:hypothetical protein